VSLLAEIPVRFFFAIYIWLQRKNIGLVGKISFKVVKLFTGRIELPGFISSLSISNNNIAGVSTEKSGGRAGDKEGGKRQRTATPSKRLCRARGFT